MIEIHIITKRIEQVDEILKMLITENLIVGATVVDTSSSYLSGKGEVSTVPSKMIFGRTKASLFGSIEKILDTKYGKNVPAIFSMPIVAMDEKHSKKLLKLLS